MAKQVTIPPLKGDKKVLPYSKRLIKFIAQEVGKGFTVYEVCQKFKDKGCPSGAQVYAWLRDERYNKAVDVIQKAMEGYADAVTARIKNVLEAKKPERVNHFTEQDVSDFYDDVTRKDGSVKRELNLKLWIHWQKQYVSAQTAMLDKFGHIFSKKIKDEKINLKGRPIQIASKELNVEVKPTPQDFSEEGLIRLKDVNTIESKD